MTIPGCYLKHNGLQRSVSNSNHQPSSRVGHPSQLPSLLHKTSVSNIATPKSHELHTQPGVKWNIPTHCQADEFPAKPSCTSRQSSYNGNKHFSSHAHQDQSQYLAQHPSSILSQPRTESHIYNSHSSCTAPGHPFNLVKSAPPPELTIHPGTATYLEPIPGIQCNTSVPGTSNPNCFTTNSGLCDCNAETPLPKSGSNMQCSNTQSIGLISGKIFKFIRSKHYGFIQTQSGQTYFLHISQLINYDGTFPLVGQNVSLLPNYNYGFSNP